jgi:AhpD family alkylhydroperoxidase
MKMSHARSEQNDFKALAPDAYDAAFALGGVASNGCAFCVQYHVLQSERLGISADKLNLVVVWREAPQFSPRERAALAWTEALTLVTAGVSDEVYAQASAEFSEQELAYLTSAVASINVWNRFGVAYRWTPLAR